MRVLLVDPPFQKFMDFSKYYIPLGLLHIAAELKKKGHEVCVYDADYNPGGKSMPFIEKMEHYHSYVEGLNDDSHPIWVEADNIFKNFKPDVVAISIVSTKFPSAMKLASRYKKLGVKRIICGGPHVTIHPDEVLAEENVDSVVVGEGEMAFERALTEEKVVAERIKNLSEISWPAREDLYNISNYKPNDLGIIMTSRGCPFNCNFCCSDVLWGRNVVYRTIDDVVAEILDINKKYGTKNFYIADDTFTCNKARVLDFCGRIKDMNFTWSCLTRVDTVDKETILAMKSAGCKMIKVGLESGNERVLGLMNKRIRKADVIRAAEIFKECDVPWMTYLIVGVPGETEAEVDETVEFIKEIKPTYVSFSVFTPYPGTVFYQQLGLHKIPYHLFNHHNLSSEYTKISPEKIMQVASFSDEWNSRSKNK